MARKLPKGRMSPPPGGPEPPGGYEPPAGMSPMTTDAVLEGDYPPPNRASALRRPGKPGSDSNPYPIPAPPGSTDKTYSVPSMRGRRKK